MYLIVLWLFFLIICILSITNTYLIIHKIIHVSSGSSVLDIDAPIGIRLRKWFFLIIALSNFLRFVCNIVFFIYYLRNDFWNIHYLSLQFIGNDSIYWKLMNSPSLIVLLNYSFLTDYIGEIYYTLNGSEYRKFFRISWIIINILFCVIISGWMIYSWFQSNMNYYYTHLLPWNFGLLGIYSTMISISLGYYSFYVIRFLLNSSYSNPSKIIARLLTLVIVVTSISLYSSITRLLQFIYYQPDKRLVDLLICFLNLV